MQSRSVIVVLGTGGTIAGAGGDANYTSAQLGVAQLVAAVPALAALPLECEQVAQIDSKDMHVEVWRALVARTAHHLERPEVQGIVVTHGTDTLEETAYLLHRVLAPARPVVLTGAMRPATSAQADGPRNLHDAVRVAAHARASGVLAVLAQAIHAGVEVRKTHAQRLDAFESGEAGPIGRLDAESIHELRPWPAAAGALGAQWLAAPRWPRVEIVISHAGADGRIVEALLAQGVEGIVVAATGSGTVHRALESALLEARARGVAVLRSTRVAAGGVTRRDDDRLPSAGALTAVQARIELMLRLLARMPQS